MMPIPAARPMRPALRKEMVIRDTSELDCMTVVLVMPRRMAFPYAVRRLAQHGFQGAAREGFKALFQRHHAKKKQRQAGGDDFEVGADPETVGRELPE